MRTLILLTVVSAMVGCQHGQKCTQSYRSMSPFSGCNVRDAGNCRDQSSCRRPCDLSTTCRKIQSSCQKVCQTPSNLSCKKPGIGWKEVRVPVLKLKDQRRNCVSGRSYSDNSCHTQPSCDLGSCSEIPMCGPKVCCTQSSPGGCTETRSPNTEATPFLTLPPQPDHTVPAHTEAAVPQPQAWQVRGPMQQPIASSTTMNLDRRTQALEAQVNQLQSMLQQRQATNLPHDNFINQRGMQNPQKEVIMLPPPQWRTMDGVPPIPNSSIEQTSGYRTNSGTYRTAGNPQMWQHSPQNIQRSMYR